MVSDGIVLIDKPSGMSSAKVVSQVKKKFKARKVGHAGTLDPAATGLLVCVLNKATRLAQYAEGGKKRYTGEIALGVTSSTDDLEGEVQETAKPIPPFSEVEQAIRSFLGDIEQIPPQISAVKVDGKRAYARARAGEKLSLRARRVTIFSYEVSPGTQPDRIAFDVSCSKGTYIRSLARDLGELLGCGAALATLRREESYPFSCAQAVSLEDLTTDHMLPWHMLFPDTETLELSHAEATRLVQGDMLTLQQVVPIHTTAHKARRLLMYKEGGTTAPLGVLVKKDGKWGFGVNVAS